MRKISKLEQRWLDKRAANHRDAPAPPSPPVRVPAPSSPTPPAPPPAPPPPTDPPTKPDPPADPIVLPAVSVTDPGADVPTPVDRPATSRKPTGGPRALKLKPSTNVDSARLLDGDVLEVTFKGGAVHRYSGFTAAHADEWEAASSAGQWFHHMVRMRPKTFPEIKG